MVLPRGLGQARRSFSFFFFLKLNRERRPLGGLHRHTEKHQVLENHGIFKFTVIVPRERT